MNINELRFIVSVARERNFRRAAEKCHVSQPALSLAIQKLEDELGQKIFERGRAEVTPTGVGLKIVEQAQRALEEIAKIKEISRAGRDQLSEPLKLGVIFSVGPYLLPELVLALKKTAPKMPLEIEENLTENLDLRLKNGTLDAVLIALPFEGSAITIHPLYDEIFEVLVPKDHALALKREIDPADLSGEKVLLQHGGHCFSNQVLEACPDVTRKDAVQGNSLETIRNMVASGLGVTVLPASANKFASPLTVALPFVDPKPVRRIALAWRKSFPRSQAIEALLGALGEISLPGTAAVK